MQKLTVSLQEAAKICRDHGWPVSHIRLADGIVSGAYPFGRVYSIGNTGRRSFEIFRKDLTDYLDSLEA